LRDESLVSATLGDDIGEPPRGLSNGSADGLKNRGPSRGPRDANIWDGGGTSGPEPKVAEKVGMGLSLEGKGTFSISEPVTAVKSSPGSGSWAFKYLGKPLPKLYRQMTPSTNEAQERKTEADDITPKNGQVINVQVNVLAKNITPQPPR